MLATKRKNKKIKTKIQATPIVTKTKPKKKLKYKDESKERIKNINKEKVSTKPFDKEIKRILIGNPKPQDKSPFFYLAKQQNITIDFHPFVNIKEIQIEEIKKQKIDFVNHDAVIFSSKHAVDNFFRVMNALKMMMPSHTIFLSTSPTVHAYLKKSGLCRRHKKRLLDVDPLNKFQSFFRQNNLLRFLFVYSVMDSEEILSTLKQYNCNYNVARTYFIQSNDIAELMTKGKYDLVCLFSPGSVKSIFDNFPNYKKKKTKICVYGNNTYRVAKAYKLEPDFLVGIANSPSSSIIEVLSKAILNSKK